MLVAMYSWVVCVGRSEGRSRSRKDRSRSRHWVVSECKSVIHTDDSGWQWMIKPRGWSVQLRTYCKTARLCSVETELLLSRDYVMSECGIMTTRPVTQLLTVTTWYNSRCWPQAYPVSICVAVFAAKQKCRQLQSSSI